MIRKLKNNIAATLAEVLIVVSITAILAAAAFIGVAGYQRSLKQLELDGIAKEIFVAAQNHLSAFYGEVEKDDNEKSDGADNDIRYYVVNGKESFEGSPMLREMLPFGSVDDTVRTGGSYILRYSKKAKSVLDVFYCESETAQFGYRLSGSDYDILMASPYYGAEGRSHRRNYNKAVVGYYGVGAGDINGTISNGSYIREPYIKVINGDKLYVVVTDNNSGNAKVALKLIITGENNISGAQESVEVPLISTTGSLQSINADSYSGNEYTYALDDITTPGRRFCERFSTFRPGCDITIEAIAYNNYEYTNIAMSGTRTVNSLFAALTDKDDKKAAKISSIRHLENLDQDKSNLSTAYIVGNTLFAEQTTDLSWNSFKNNTTADAVYYPVNPNYDLNYNGFDNSIQDLTVATDSAAGLFGALYNSTVKDLELINFNIKSSGASAGALAGSISNSTVSGVIARNDNSSDDSNLEINALYSAGGLAGEVNGTTVTLSAASVYVRSEGGNAGGFIGSAIGSAISSSYSGGHTSSGTYSHVTNLGMRGHFNVIAEKNSGSAGGLIGRNEGTNISTSYSTCSATGSVAGGLIGSLAGGSIDASSYAVGLVEGSVTGSRVGSARDTDAPDLLDEAARRVANPYDLSLIGTYGGKYCFKTIDQLRGTVEGSKKFTEKHYGDWKIVIVGGLDIEPDNGDKLTVNVLLPLTDDKGAEISYKNKTVIFSVSGQDSNNTKLYKIKLSESEGSIKATVEKTGSIGASSRITWEDPPAAAEGTANAPGSQLPIISYVPDYAERYAAVSLILDDITTPGCHFTEILGDVITPGENINLRAIDNDTERWDDIKNITGLPTNGLFQTSQGTIGEANISCIRHLQNLDTAISGVSPLVKTANLLSDLSWYGPYQTGFGGYGTIYSSDSSKSIAGSFYGIYNENLTEFNGNDHELSDFDINSAPDLGVNAGIGNAGLFREVSSDLAIKDLMLRDFNIDADAAAAAAVAQVAGGGSVSFDTVLALADHLPVTGGTAGGLVGLANGMVTINNSASTCIVAAGGAAGGLIGQATGGYEITDSYAGGHTANAVYDLENYNVTSLSGYAGGLIGVAGSGSISTTFSAASVEGGASGGGTIGRLNGSVSMDRVYVVAPVKNVRVTESDGVSSSGAFIGLIEGGSVSSENGYIYYVPELYAGAEQTSDEYGNSSSVAYAGYDSDACPRVKLAYYNADGENAIAATNRDASGIESTMQSSTLSFDPALIIETGRREYPFAIWTTFSFETGSSRRTYYGDWQPVLNQATQLVKIRFFDYDPLLKVYTDVADTAEAALQNLRAGRDNTIQLPFLNQKAGYAVSEWRVYLVPADISVNTIGNFALGSDGKPKDGALQKITADSRKGNITITSKTIETVKKESTEDNPYMLAAVPVYKETEKLSVRFYYDKTGKNQNFQLITDLAVPKNTKYKNVTVPNRVIGGYTFDGWYTSSDFTNRIDFTSENLIEQSFAAYAKYVKIEYATMTVDFLYQIDGGETSHLNSVPKYSINDPEHESSYRVTFEKNVGLDKDILLPVFDKSAYNSTKISVYYYEDDETKAFYDTAIEDDAKVLTVKKNDESQAVLLTAALDADSKNVNIKTKESMRIAVVYHLDTGAAPEGMFKYQIWYRLDHTANSAYAYGTNNYEYNRYGTTFADTPDGSTPDIVLEGIEGFSCTTTKKDLEKNRTEVGTGDNKVVRYWVDYEREQYTLSYDSKSGSYVEPKLLYYGQPLTTSGAGVSTRKGYELDPQKPWTYYKKGDENKTIDKSPVTYKSSDPMPQNNVVAVANWKAANTTYRVMYWIENADDYEYSYLGSVSKNSTTGSTVSAANDVPTSILSTSEKAYFTFNAPRSDSNVTVKGDGSTIVNVYYKRNQYTLSFYDTAKCGIDEHKHTDACYAYSCGDKAHTQHTAECLICGKTEHTHTSACCSLTVHTHTAACCSIPEHAHTAACCSKEEHMHTVACCSKTEHIYHNKSCYSNIESNASNTGWGSAEEGTVKSKQTGIISKTYYIYIEGKWYKLTSGSKGNVSNCPYGGLHKHGTDCSYTKCGKTAHTHTDGTCVYTKCGKTAHTHGVGCNSEKCTVGYEHNHNDGHCNYTCGLSEHTHSEANGCYKDKLHVHTDDCRELICGKAEHTHSSNCNNSGKSNLVYQVTRKYNALITDIFPIESNAKKYEGYQWTDTNKTLYTQPLQTLDRMPGKSVRFDAKWRGTDKAIYYYLEVVGDEKTSISTTFSNVKKYYKEYKVVKHNFNYLTEAEEFHLIDGFDRYAYSSGSQNPTQYTKAQSQYSITNNKNSFYYSRKKYNLEFYYSDLSTAAVTKSVQYEAVINGHAAVPAMPSEYSGKDYTFSGWYLDPGLKQPLPANYQMPLGNMALYGRWIPPERTIKFYSEESDIGKKSPLYSFTVELGQSIDDEITDPQGNIKPDYKPVKENVVFDNWYYKVGNTEKQFIPSMAIQENMTVYAKWTDIEDEDEKIYRDVTVRYCVEGNGIKKYAYEDGSGNIVFCDPGNTAETAGKTLLQDVIAHKEVGKTVIIKALNINGYYSTSTIQHHRVNKNNENNLIEFTYVSIEPWHYTVKYYVNYSSYATAEISGYTFSAPATYAIDYPAGENINAYNQYETIAFVMPDGYETNYTYVKYRYGSEEGTGNLVTIHPDADRQALVEFYIEPDYTAIDLSDASKKFNGRSIADEMETAMPIRNHFADSRVESIEKYVFFEPNELGDDWQQIEPTQIINSGVYRMNGFVIIKVTGQSVNDSAESTRYYLLWKDESKRLNLKIQKREVTVTSKDAEKEFDPGAATSLVDNGYTLLDSEGHTKKEDIFVTHGGITDGISVAFSVDSFRKDPGMTENSFRINLNNPGMAGNYEFTSVFGNLDVFWKYSVDVKAKYNAIDTSKDKITVSGIGTDNHEKEWLLTRNEESNVDVQTGDVISTDKESVTINYNQPDGYKINGYTYSGDGLRSTDGTVIISPKTNYVPSSAAEDPHDTRTPNIGNLDFIISPDLSKSKDITDSVLFKDVTVNYEGSESSSQAPETEVIVGAFGTDKVTLMNIYRYFRKKNATSDEYEEIGFDKVIGPDVYKRYTYTVLKVNTRAVVEGVEQDVIRYYLVKKDESGTHTFTVKDTP